MRHAVALALLLGASGCVRQELQGPMPVLLRFQPPERGGPTMLPEASPSGVLDLTGACVALEIRPGELSTIISTADASVGRDSRGLYLQFRKRRFRHGSWVKGGGGHSDRLPPDGPLQGPVPAECSTGPFLIFYGIEPFVPSNGPPRSPPPPPIDG